MKRIGVLISGGGTNLQALIDAQGSVLKSGKIVCVCSNSADAYGLERAKKAGIPTKVIRKKADCGGDGDKFSRRICGYMKEMQYTVHCFKAHMELIIIFVLMMEKTYTCKRHSHIVLIAGINHIIVADRTAGLRDYCNP